MADKLSRSARSANMARVRSRDTGPEMIVRRLIHGMGYRYRLHARELPGRPDLVFRSRKRVIFVHGCFWHSHPGCRRAALPQSNVAFWEKKIGRNVKRDVLQLETLVKSGWKVLVIWECATRNQEELVADIRQFLDA